MRRNLFFLLAVVGLAAVLAVPAAFAGNAHFISSFSSATLSGSDLTCSFKEAGLESGSVENIICTATAETTYECVNNGGHNPAATNKTTTVTQASSPPRAFTATKNGNVSGTTNPISPPTAAQLGFTCPSGQTVTFVSVCYTNVMVVDTTSGASDEIAGTFCYTNPNAP